MRAGGDGPGHVGRIVEGGQHHDPRIRGRGADPFDGVEAVLAPHANIEQHDVGLVLAGEFCGLLAVGRLGDQFDIGIRDQAGDAPTDYFMVIDDENFESHDVRSATAKPSVRARDSSP